MMHWMKNLVGLGPKVPCLTCGCDQRRHYGTTGRGHCRSRRCTCRRFRAQVTATEKDKAPPVLDSAAFGAALLEDDLTEEQVCLLLGMTPEEYLDQNPEQTYATLLAFIRRRT